MYFGDKLSIAIATYQRAALLDICLRDLVSVVAKYGIPIYISNNNSTDDTLSVIHSWMARYPRIYLNNKPENVGADENIESALRFSKSDYVWLIGDTYKISAESLARIISHVDASEPNDFIVVNAKYRVKDVPPKIYISPSELMADLGWHMTCMATLIYKRSNIERLSLEKYRKSNFLQTAIIFEYVAKNNFRVSWLPDISVDNINMGHLRKISWEDRLFDVWMVSWPEFIYSLPASYGCDVKRSCALDHGVKAKIFDMLGFLRMRRTGQYGIVEYFRYRKYFHCAVVHHEFLMLLIAIMPSLVVAIGLKFHALWRRFYVK
jgi:abequosyltransferase